VGLEDKIVPVTQWKEQSSLLIFYCTERDRTKTL